VTVFTVRFSPIKIFCFFETHTAFAASEDVELVGGSEEVLPFWHTLGDDQGAIGDLDLVAIQLSLHWGPPGLKAFYRFVALFSTGFLSFSMIVRLHSQDGVKTRKYATTDSVTVSTTYFIFG